MLLARPLALHRGYLPSPPEEPWLFNKFDANSRGIVRAASWTDHESRSSIANNAADSGRSEVHHALRALIEEVKQVEPGFLPVGHINQLFSDALVAYIVYRWADGNRGRLLQAQCDELSRHFYIFAYNLRKLEPGRFDQTIRTLFTPLIKMALLPRGPEDLADLARSGATVGPSISAGKRSADQVADEGTGKDAGGSMKRPKSTAHSSTSILDLYRRVGEGHPRTVACSPEEALRMMPHVRTRRPEASRSAATAYRSPSPRKEVVLPTPSAPIVPSPRSAGMPDLDVQSEVILAQQVNAVRTRNVRDVVNAVLSSVAKTPGEAARICKTYLLPFVTDPKFIAAVSLCLAFAIYHNPDYLPNFSSVFPDGILAYFQRGEPHVADTVRQCVASRIGDATVTPKLDAVLQSLDKMIDEAGVGVDVPKHYIGRISCESSTSSVFHFLAKNKGKLSNHEYYTNFAKAALCGTFSALGIVEPKVDA
ncbi:hypothetical protein FB107DRAFT_268436 [Schizophyllum commune]